MDNAERKKCVIIISWNFNQAPLGPFRSGRYLYAEKEENKSAMPLLVLRLAALVRQQVRGSYEKEENKCFH